MKYLLFIFGLITVNVFSFSAAFSQGSIYGSVKNSDASVPANGEIKFFGYLDDTDEEIRIESSTGAGYDAGNWFDDFQNYLTEGPGNPYRYHFINVANGESSDLSGEIPINSFQREDVYLEAASPPLSPIIYGAHIQPDSTVRIAWEYNSACTYRIYRRLSTSDGSFFRIDNTDGLIDDPGVNDSVYIDYSTYNGYEYDYLIIPFENNIPGVHSDIVSVYAGFFLCGDADDNGFFNILDITFIIRYLYKGGVPVEPWQSFDVNSSGDVNILDITYFIRYLYKGGPEPVCPEKK
ncbi:MAG: dockerin type I repeat-containing protein [Candidatus Zixiibacteriota bacterium]